MISKIVSFAMAIASRGFSDNKIDQTTKQLRYVSCFGTDTIKPCFFLKKSKNSNYHYCGACGCGDFPHTWLVKGPGEYSKLDYPKLTCPLMMPGFTNFDPTFYPHADPQRKKDVENIEIEKLNLIQITVNNDPVKEKIVEDIKNINENS
ncbi:hypothetical protein EBU91_01420 [bacterium]|jgi:hypothetical protein|nr:hypothetical protein [bacterium]